MQRSLRLVRAVRLAVLFALLFAARPSGAAGPIDPKLVPEPLKPWTEWVLHGKEASLCPTFNGAAELQRCIWPSRLELVLDEKGGHFSQGFQIDAKAWVPLPGDEKRWPQDVKIGAARAVVTSQHGVPSVELDRGAYVVTGSFAWDSPPESLQVPPETGLLSLKLRGAAIEAPNRDANGIVWLQKTSSKEEGEKLELVVHRKVQDDIPLLLTTRIELNVAGKNREVLLGKSLPPGFVPMSLDTQLPARVEPDSRLRVQVRPGTWTIVLVARSEAVVSALKRSAPEGPWREGEEVWVFEAKNDLRLVTVEGVSAIDPQQTTLTADWKRLPAYPMKVGDTLSLIEKRRGDADPPPNQLALARTLWLDFAGGGYTVSDTLTGTLNRDSRLEMAPPTTLGRVAIHGQNQFITHLADPKQTGVEVRQGELNVSADSRIVGDISDIPAVGWKHDFHQVSGVLHLPPGWRLFYASGVDDVPHTWVRHWSLFELFLGLIIALAIGRLYGVKWGAVALVMLALTFPEDDAPKWTWLLVLAPEALIRVLPVGKAQQVFKVARMAALIVITLVTIPFLVAHVRVGLYPALENPDAVMGTESDTSSSTVSGFMDMTKNVNTPSAAEAPVPVSPPVQSDEKKKDNDKEESEGDKGGKAGSYAKRPSLPAGSATSIDLFRSASREINAQVYDPNAIVQTGPGLPRWQWTSIDLHWSGPVESGQRLKLRLLSPADNLVLAFLRAALLVLVLLRLFPWIDRFLPESWRRIPSAAAAVTTLLVLAVWPASARAQYPDKPMLDELESRLLAKPACSPTCASSPRLLIEARSKTLRMRMEVDASATTAVPLPGGSTQWAPSSVLLDDKPAQALLRTTDGKLWIELAAGSHQVIAEGPMPERESVQLALHLKPHRVEATTEGWTVEGLHEDGLADDNVQFTRIRAATGAPASALLPGALPAFVRIERTLILGLNWQVETRVVRVTPTGAAVVLEVPLLAGESVTTADIRVVSGKALVNMGPQAQDVSWRSVLEQKSPIRLVAPKSIAAAEVWRVDVGPIWHAVFSGIPFVHTQPTGGTRIPEWRPWPGEQAAVEVTRPDGTPGQTLTVDRSVYEIRPGLRATDATLTLTIRASRGLEHTVTLPENAVLESISINGATQPIRQEGRKVVLPIVPGPQTVRLGWRETPGIATYFRSSDVDLGTPSVNASTQIAGLGSRWILFLGGPRVGPVVLFWSLLLVLLLVSAALGKVKWVPLRTWQWMLLALGISQIPIVAAAVVVGWLLVLGWRRERPTVAWGIFGFNLRQIVIVGWTLAALTILGVAIHQGLLGAPEMQIRGNGGSSESLTWFSDRSDGTLPAAWMISVPILVYRGAMLLWALWVALAVLRWLKFGWTAFTTEGAWKRRPPRPVIYGPPPGAAAPPPMAPPPPPV